jgi:hypothetical protein
MSVTVVLLRHLDPQLYLIGHRQLTNKHSVGPRINNYKSCNNVPIKIKSGNTVCFTALTWCLSARFAPFPSGSRVVKCNNGSDWVSGVYSSYSCTGLRDPSMSSDFQKPFSYRSTIKEGLSRRWSDTWRLVEPCRACRGKVDLQWPITQGTCGCGSWLHLQSHHVCC